MLQRASDLEVLLVKNLKQRRLEICALDTSGSRQQVSSPEEDSRLCCDNEKILVHISYISRGKAPSISTQCGGTMYLAYKLLVSQILVGKPEGKNHFGDPCVDGRIILR
jgi:hypothetical protein